jgi:phosphotransferase system enzyme I (PtsP)
MRGPPAGPRVLLRRLREIMAEPISAQERLDKIVTQIAANMVAEVCSAYVLRADGVLELYATEGLKAEAVHQAQLRVGQGLVGTIAAEARPLNLPDAQSHPAFQYLPETGEEDYSSFLGVPILRAGRTLGCSSSRTARTAPTTTRKSRRCRRRRWCSPRCWRSASSSGSPRPAPSSTSSGR